MHIIRMAGLINSVALILVFCSLAFANGLNCTNRCCYYYSNVPKNVTTISCNPQGMDINWLCQIHAPPNDTNVSIQWYKAGPGTAESDIMADGELLSELSGKYSFTIDRQVLAVNNHTELNGLFWDRFVLTIHNFNSSTDDGYYWCQIVANGTCPLESSPTGYLALDQFPVEKCPYNLLDFTDSVVPPICAEGTLYHAEEQTTSTLASDERVNNHTSSETILITSMTVILYGIIGGLFLIIIFLLLIIVACTVCNVRSRKMNKAITANKDKHYTGPSLNDYNNQPTKSDNDAIEMDAPGGTKDTPGRKQPLLPPSNNATQSTQESATPTMHVLTSSDGEVKYAQPGAVCQPRLNPLEVSTHSEPTQYQGLRASGVNVISAYHVPQVGKHEYGSGGVKADPMYANLPK